MLENLWAYGAEAGPAGSGDGARATGRAKLEAVEAPAPVQEAQGRIGDGAAQEGTRDGANSLLNAVSQWTHLLRGAGTKVKVQSWAQGALEEDIRSVNGTLIGSAPGQGGELGGELHGAVRALGSGPGMRWEPPGGPRELRGGPGPT